MGRNCRALRCIRESEEVDSKLKAHSAPGTPLTIKWTAGSIETEPPEAHRGFSANELVALVLGFIIGLAVFGPLAWLLGQRLWIVDALLGGFSSALHIHRWAAKHLGGDKAETMEAVSTTLSTAAIKKHRRMYSIPGIVIGFVAVGVAAWLQGETRWIWDAFMGSLGGYEVAVGFGQRFRGLETLDDLGLVRMRKGMSPLDLKPDDPVPVTLKSAGERIARR